MKRTNLLLLLVFLCLASGCTPTAQEPIDYVSPLIGTGFHGHTYPGATRPFGAVQLSPDTRRGNWDACSGYHYSDSTLFGFSHTHLSGTGCIDLGDILFRPTTQPINLTSEGDIYKPATFLHEQEKAVAGYYTVNLLNEEIKAELTATTYVGMHRYSYPQDGSAAIIVDLAHTLTDEYIYEAELEQTAPNELSGMRRTRGWVDNQYIYFVAQFSHPIDSIAYISNKKKVAPIGKLTGSNLQAILYFNTTVQPAVVSKVGLSLVSNENARTNLTSDVKGFDFDAVREESHRVWKEALTSITVEGGSEADKSNFYTALYHSLIVPNTVSDVNGEYRRHDLTIAQLPAGSKEYSTFSLWDTFRAWHPLMTLIDSTFVNGMVNSLLNVYDASGELPLWSLASGETETMIGYHAASVIADAYLKGIRNFDAEKALNALEISSEKNKKGADYYIKYGFIPSNIKKESVSCLLEFAYDDWCIAQMAKAMGREETYHKYIERSQNYVNAFDGSTRFFRGKRMDGNWESPFNPFQVGRAYTEATAWQYRFFVPHDVEGMVQLYGGKEAFTASLDSLFSVESKVDGTMQDITGLIGQYAHGNEPSHHMAYLYNYIGQPWKTQEMTRRLLHEMYQPTPEGISGNEDCGQMSAWYILSSLGLYSVCPGSNEFALTTPLFEKATIRLASGKELVITANQPAKNLYIDKVKFNGKVITENFITYAQLMEGGELTYSLTNRPNKERGTKQQDAPYSYTQELIVSMPYIVQDLHLFENQVEVSINSTTEGSTIYYTLDGTEPTESSIRYNTPFTLTETAHIKAKGFKEGFVASRTLHITATRAELKEALQVNPTQNGTSYSYYEGLYQKVADIEKSPLIEKGILGEPSIAGAKQKDHFAFIFSGLIQVPEDGIYTFQTRSDDGSILLINDEKVVDNDGSHAAIPATGRVALKKGFHSYKLYYFEDYEGEHLSWSWQTPSDSKLAPIPAIILFLK
ncbi:MAG: GH92 family glycosyl hydrolase [Phocaeicola sp.]